MNKTLSNALHALENNDITFILRDGKTLQGTVKEVGADYVAIALSTQDGLAYIPFHSIVNFFGPEYVPSHKATVI